MTEATPAPITKKALTEALRPYRVAFERCVLAHMRGARVTLPAPAQFAGFTIEAQFVRHGRVVCGVPMPYAAGNIQYQMKDAADGAVVVGHRSGVGEFAAVAMRVFRDRGLAR